MRIQIKTQKTQLYQLITRYCPYPMPKLMYTNFKKGLESNSYILEWSIENLGEFIAYVSCINNAPRLVISIEDNMGDNESIKMYKLDIVDLIKRGMIKGIRHEWQLKYI